MIKYIYIYLDMSTILSEKKKFVICAVEISFEVVCFDVVGAFKSYSILFICIWKCFCISPKEKFIFSEEKIREEFLREQRRLRVNDAIYRKIGYETYIYYIAFS